MQKHLQAVSRQTTSAQEASSISHEVQEEGMELQSRTAGARSVWTRQMPYRQMLPPKIWRTRRAGLTERATIVNDTTSAGDQGPGDEWVSRTDLPPQ